MPNDGRITIETRNVRIDDDYLATRAEEIEPGWFVMLAISNTGAGLRETNWHLIKPVSRTNLMRAVFEG